MRKRLCCLLLALVLILALAPAAMAQDEQTPHYGAVEIDGVTVGFASYFDEQEQALFIMKGDPDTYTHYGSSYVPSSAKEGYVPYYSIYLRAGRPSDNSDLFAEAQDVELTVRKLWIEPLEGGEDAFSWSADETVLELEPTTDRVQLYAKEKAAKARLWATVEVGDKTHNVSARARMTALEVEASEHLSLEELQRQLNTKEFQHGIVYRFSLAPGKHSGTLTLPENLTGMMIYICGAENGSTTIEGSIDLNGSSVTEIAGISFAAPESENTKAIYNGCCMSVANCSFYNYETALDSTAAGLVNPSSGNLFVNNETAVSVDVKRTNLIAHVPCSGNTFINNATAVKITSLHFAVGPFRFRISGCNFINNGKDFDVSWPGTYYFYRNYFGQYEKETGKPVPGNTADGKNNGQHDLNLDSVLQARSLNSLNMLLTTRTAQTYAADGVKLVTNPRWAYPVARWWHLDVLDEDAVFGNVLVEQTRALLLAEEEPEYVNYLTSDWDGTEIVNDEAEELLLDERAFEASGEKTVDVVSVKDEGAVTEMLGTWVFD